MTRFYSLHSIITSVSAWPELMAAVAARLEPFSIAPVGDTEMTIAFEAATGRDAAHRPAPAGRRVYDFPGGEVAYDDERRRLTIAVGDRVRAWCDAAAGQARVVMDAPAASDLYLLSHPVLSVLLMELLKYRGLYPVHAAGVALNGRGVLLPGTSGAGKSTLSVALARRGFAFLSDDTVFLQEDRSGWRVRAFPDQVDLCADTVGRFPELEDLDGDALPPGWKKRQIRVESVYDTPIAWDAPPQVLIFPAISGRRGSAIRALSADEALLELTPNVLLTDAGGSQRHLDALAAVASQCTCYRLDTGTDLDAAADLVRRTVA